MCVRVCVCVCVCVSVCVCVVCVCVFKSSQYCLPLTCLPRTCVTVRPFLQGKNSTRHNSQCAPGLEKPFAKRGGGVIRERGEGLERWVGGTYFDSYCILPVLP